MGFKSRFLQNVKPVSYTHLESEDELGKGKKIISVYQEDDLELRQELTLYECGDLTVQIFLNGNGDKVQTRYMVPFFAPYPDASGKEIFLSLDQKMMLVPYDNDMWLRYESSVPAAGRASYDVTAIYNEDTLEGMAVSYTHLGSKQTMSPVMMPSASASALLSTGSSRTTSMTS